MNAICLLSFLAALATFTSAVKLGCTYVDYAVGGPLGVLYTCWTWDNLIDEQNPTIFTNVSGTHMAGKYNEDVKSVIIQNNPTLVAVPKGLEFFFENLESFMWIGGILSTVDSSTFAPFLNIKVIHISYNKIVSLDGDVFKHTRNLKLINIEYNLLAHVGHDLLTGLAELTYADFNSNPCINILANTPQGIQELNVLLPIRCPPLVTTPDPTTTRITPTTEQPILSSCYAISHLVNKENGNYMKSYCIFDIRPSGYDQAEETCRDNNMNLFVIENSTMQSAFFAATTNDLGIYGNSGFLWINGRKESNDEWFTFNPDRAPLTRVIDWVQTETVDGRVSGDCLGYSSEQGHYQARGAACNRQHWCSCEFYE